MESAHYVDYFHDVLGRGGLLFRRGENWLCVFKALYLARYFRVIQCLPRGGILYYHQSQLIPAEEDIGNSYMRYTTKANVKSRRETEEKKVVEKIS